MTLIEELAPGLRVGVPIAERALTDALDNWALASFSPGSGRSLIHLREVEIGTGRPDAILVAVSSLGLRSRYQLGLRLPSLAHARVLDSIRSGRPSAYSKGHVRQLTKSLRELGWLDCRNRVLTAPSLVERSLIIEAKMSDWRRGIGQLSRARWAGHSAALLMPVDTQHRAFRPALKHNRIGMLVFDGDRLTWQIQAPSIDLRWSADLWLTELAIRAGYDG
ncbi:MAG: hypothetical protein ACC652_11140 [Acidimicrobiales bacterium]